MKKQQSITSLPASPEDERRSRMIKYSVAMVVRVACFALIFVVPDWWRVLPAIGAIFLPYLAVVIANVGSARTTHVPQPERLALTGADTPKVGES
jgi:predicted tellurium resistance membrane protein TerC